MILVNSSAMVSVVDVVLAVGTGASTIRMAADAARLAIVILFDTPLWIK
jgi:hypothetical protein